jgi:hypothetical protein
VVPICCFPERPFYENLHNSPLAFSPPRLKDDGMTEAPRWQDVTILKTDGDAIPIATLWSERPTVLVFLRHFG